MDSLAGRVAIVTGAAGRLGRAISNALAREGAVVHGVDIHGDNCLHADVATAEGNLRMVDHAVRRSGRLDVLALNAGAQFAAPIAQFPDDQWELLMSVMAKGPFMAIREAWPYLTARRHGRVIVTASLSSFVAEPHKVGYVAAKHAALGVVRVAALEGAEWGLTANAVAPAWMDTPMLRQQLTQLALRRGIPEDAVLEQLRVEQPGGRFIDTAEVAELVAFLAGERSSGINGACIPVDLGLSAS